MFPLAFQGGQVHLPIIVAHLERARGVILRVVGLALLAFGFLFRAQPFRVGLGTRQPLGVFLLLQFGDEQQQRIDPGDEPPVAVGFRSVGRGIPARRQRPRRQVGQFEVALVVQNPFEAIQRVDRGVGLGILLDQPAQPRFGRGVVAALAVELRHVQLVLGQNVARRPALVLGVQHEGAFGIAVDDVLKESVGPPGHGLVAVQRSDLRIVGDPQKILDERHVRAGRIGPLEILQQGDRLDVILLHEVAVGILEQGFFGVGVERILVEQLLILVRRVKILLLLEGRRGLLMVFFRGRSPERGRAPRDAQQGETQAGYAGASRPRTVRHSPER